MLGSDSTDEFIDLSVGRIAVRRTVREGPVDGTVLLINGAIATVSTTRWAEKGLTRHNLVAFDFPNMGRSRELNPTLGVVSKEAEAKTVLELISLFRPQHLISVSWGGTALLLTLLERPSHVRSAVVASYSLGLSEALVGLSRSLLELSKTGDRAAAADLIVNGLGAYLSAGFKRLYHGYFMNLDPVQMLYAAEQIRYVMAQKPNAYLDSFRRIEIPILFTNGALDLYTAPESIRPIGAFIPTASFHVVPGAGHFMANESRAAQTYVAAMVNSFLATGEVDMAPGTLPSGSVIHPEASGQLPGER